MAEETWKIIYSEEYTGPAEEPVAPTRPSPARDRAEAEEIETVRRRARTRKEEDKLDDEIVKRKKKRKTEAETIIEQVTRLMSTLGMGSVGNLVRDMSKAVKEFQGDTKSAGKSVLSTLSDVSEGSKGFTETIADVASGEKLIPRPKRDIDIPRTPPPAEWLGDWLKEFETITQARAAGTGTASTWHIGDIPQQEDILRRLGHVGEIPKYESREPSNIGMKPYLTRTADEIIASKIGRTAKPAPPQYPLGDLGISTADLMNIIQMREAVEKVIPQEPAVEGGGAGGGEVLGTKTGGGGEDEKPKNAVVEMAGNLKDINKTSGSAMKQGIKIGAAIAGIAGMATFVVSLLKRSKIFSTYMDTMITIIGAMIDIFLIPFLPLFVGIIKGMAKMIPIVMDMAKAMEPIGEYLGEQIGKVVEGIVNIIKWAVNFMIDPIGTLEELMLNIITKIGEMLIGGIFGEKFDIWDVLFLPFTPLSIIGDIIEKSPLIQWLGGIIEKLPGIKWIGEILEELPGIKWVGQILEKITGINPFTFFFGEGWGTGEGETKNPFDFFFGIFEKLNPIDFLFGVVKAINPFQFFFGSEDGEQKNPFDYFFGIISKANPFKYFFEDFNPLKIFGDIFIEGTIPELLKKILGFFGINIGTGSGAGGTGAEKEDYNIVEGIRDVGKSIANLALSVTDMALSFFGFPDVIQTTTKSLIMAAEAVQAAGENLGDMIFGTGDWFDEEALSNSIADQLEDQLLTNQINDLSESMGNIGDALEAGVDIYSQPEPDITVEEYNTIYNNTYNNVDWGALDLSNFGVIPMPSINVGYQTGTGFVPKDMMAMVHQGEAVIPEEINRIFAPMGGALEYLKSFAWEGKSPTTENKQTTNTTNYNRPINITNTFNVSGDQNRLPGKIAESLDEQVRKAWMRIY